LDELRYRFLGQTVYMLELFDKSQWTTGIRHR